MFVPILLGSNSDKPHAEKIVAELEKFGIESEVRVISAHKVPEMCVEYIKEMNKREDVVYVTCAGRSNGLSGVISGSALHPVVACPPFKDKADYLVNIHSTLQMPSSTPAMAVLDPNNVALAIAKIFALKDAEMRSKVIEAIAAVKEEFSK
ncbi:5-(carboxyamino)imidazole ribonucleotide mutase [Candidatus Peregrinibacteria bacterium CG11_big_fil_rev_8_21_14_0_20_46_8]|nr:MAG: 5-(carboxyamino)imidazole ribonucleotide mutase [Candidatus Peregrinibacteria bacterium CG11_big_fil_rev_8_21_14_0_20_46_8]